MNSSELKSLCLNYKQRDERSLEMNFAYNDYCEPKSQHPARFISHTELTNSQNVNCLHSG